MRWSCLPLVVLTVGNSGCPIADDDSSGPDASAPADAGASLPDASTPARCDGCEVIRHVRVMDADGVREDQRVSIKDSRIMNVQKDGLDAVPGAAREVDGSGKTVLPGLWEMHSHTPPEPALGSMQTELPAHLKGFLYSGVTSVFDMGSSREGIFALRSRVRDGSLLAPRFMAVGPMLTAVGGHPCIDGYSEETCALLPDVAAAQRKVDALAPSAPDMVKLIIEGGVAPLSPIPRVTAEMVQAVVEAARAKGLKVVAHVSTTQDALDAAHAGVAALAHVPVSEPLPADVITTLKSSGMHLVPTLAVYDAMGHYLDDPAYLDCPLVTGAITASLLSTLKDPATRQRLESEEGQKRVQAFNGWFATAKENVRRLHEAGVPIMTGTDAGNFMVLHGPGVHRELYLLVQAGLTTQQAITAATLTPATFMGKGHELGLVKAGYLADLVLVEGDPSVNIQATEAVHSVWLNGRMLDRDSFSSSASHRALVVDMQQRAQGAFCVGDLECQQGLGCDPFTWQCNQQCSIDDPTTCPNGFACFTSAPSAPGFCYKSAGCDPLRQDCPFNDVYKNTCLPWEADYSFCAGSGTKGQGEACQWRGLASDCAPGFYCGLGNQCYALCDPAGQALSQCPEHTQCADLSSSWGYPVGLCVQR